ncbi:MAG: hypothetical protein V2A73_16230, partial [Pseudomonadota bacterium]
GVAGAEADVRFQMAEQEFKEVLVVAPRVTDIEEFTALLTGAWEEYRLLVPSEESKHTGSPSLAVLPLTKGIQREGDYLLKSSLIRLTVVDYSGLRGVRQQRLFLGAAWFAQADFPDRQQQLGAVEAAISPGSAKVIALASRGWQNRNATEPPGRSLPSPDSVLVTFLTNLAVAPGEPELLRLLHTIGSAIPEDLHDVIVQFGDATSLRRPDDSAQSPVSLFPT